MKTLTMFLALAAAGCSIGANLNKGSPQTTPVSEPRSQGARAPASALITIPELVWKSESDARATLAAAGHTGTVSVSDALCPPEVDGRSVELGMVCYQHPAAGRQQGARLPIQIKVQTRAQD